VAIKSMACQVNLVLGNVEVMDLVDEIRAKVAGGAEDYACDKNGPSSLFLGFTAAGRPIHVQCRSPSRSLIKIITLHEPDPDLWEDDRRRRS